MNLEGALRCATAQSHLNATLISQAFRGGWGGAFSGPLQELLGILTQDRADGGLLCPGLRLLHYLLRTRNRLLGEPYSERYYSLMSGLHMPGGGKGEEEEWISSRRRR